MQIPLSPVQRAATFTCNTKARPRHETSATRSTIIPVRLETQQPRRGDLPTRDRLNVASSVAQAIELHGFEGLAGQVGARADTREELEAQVDCVGGVRCANDEDDKKADKGLIIPVQHV